MTFHLTAILNRVRPLPAMAVAVGFLLLPNAGPASAAGLQPVTTKIPVAPTVKFAVNPTSVDFGSVRIGTSVKRTVSITNLDSIPLEMGGADTPVGFAFSFGTCGSWLQVGETCVMSLTYNHDYEETRSGTLRVTYYTVLSTSAIVSASQSIPVSARSVNVPAQFTVMPSSVDFGTVALGTSVIRVVTITNVDQFPLESGGFQTPSWIGLSFGTCGPTLAVGQSCTVTLSFTPTQAQAYSGTLSATYYGPPSPSGMTLISGTQGLPVSGQGGMPLPGFMKF